MKFTLSVILVAVLSLAAYNQEKAKHEAAPKLTVNDLGWIGGCWKKVGKTEDSYTMEHWSKPAGMMIGFSRAVKGGRVSFFEYFRIAAENDSEIYYIVRPAGAKTETRFKLTSLKDNTAVFENPKHDFPQRIIYKLSDKDTISIRADAKKNGKFTGFGYPMKKVSCD